MYYRCTVNSNRITMSRKRTLSDANGETRKEEEKEEESPAEDHDSVYISVELTDFADYPILDKHETLEIENLESDQPILRIGEYVLYGKYEEAIGTDLYYDMQLKGDTSATSCSFVGKATKRLKFAIDPKEQRHFLRKPTKI
ncbi:unnamed protein product [Aphanomyces euteiches]